MTITYNTIDTIMSAIGDIECGLIINRLNFIHGTANYLPFRYDITSESDASRFNIELSIMDHIISTLPKALRTYGNACDLVQHMCGCTTIERLNLITKLAKYSLMVDQISMELIALDDTEFCNEFNELIQSLPIPFQPMGDFTAHYYDMVGA